MGRRIVALILSLLLVGIQAQLWQGRGSIPGVARLHRQIDEQNARNAEMQFVNERLASEISDLQQGLDMVESKARSELGMLRPNEIFVQIVK